MAPTTISIARVLQLRVPIAWQEAVEVARAAEAIAERHSRLLTVEGCIISTSGTVQVGINGADRLGVALSGLQLLAILLEGQQAPAELRALAATADDALAGFPSETKAAAEQAITLDWFVRPNPEAEIASLASRALEAAGVGPQDTLNAGSNPPGAQPRPPMTFERGAGERAPHAPVVEAARPGPSANVVPAPDVERSKPVLADRPAQLPTSAPAERRAEPSRPAAAVPGLEPARPVPAPLRFQPPAPPVVERRPEPPKPVASDRPAIRLQPAVADRIVRHEPVAANRRHDSVAVVAQFPAEVLDRPGAPRHTGLQLRPATRAISHQLSAVIDRGRRLGAAPVVVVAVTVIAAGGLAIWALFSPDLPAPITFRSLGPMTPLARALQPNLPYEGLAVTSRQTSTASSNARAPVATSVGTGGSVAASATVDGLRPSGAVTPTSGVPRAIDSSGQLIVSPPAQAMSTNAPTFTAPPNAAPIAAASAPPPSTTSPSPSGRVVTTPLGAEPRDRRVYTQDDADVEPPTMRRPQLQMERRADTEPSDSYVEVVVDEQGEVTQVRLRSSDLSLNDRMIVAAAKAWQFEPAMKDGRPVKYVLRLPVTR